VKYVLVVHLWLFALECWKIFWFCFFWSINSFLFENLLTLSLYFLLFLIPFGSINLFWHLVEHTVESIHFFFRKLPCLFLRRSVSNIGLDCLESSLTLIRQLFSENLIFFINLLQVKNSFRWQNLKKWCFWHPEIFMLVCDWFYSILWLFIPETFLSDVIIIELCYFDVILLGCKDICSFIEKIDA